MKTKVFFLTIITLILMSSVCFGNPNVGNTDINTNSKTDINKYIEKQLESMQVSKLESYFTNEYALNNVNLKSFIMDVIKGNKSIFDLLNKDVFMDYVAKEVKINLKIFASILILAVLSAILKNLDNSFSSGTISKISNYVIFLIIISLTVIGYKEVLSICKGTIDNMVSFMEIVIPIEIAILVTLGFPVTSAILNPVFLGGIVFINMIFKNFLLITMILCFSILTINSISKNIKIERFFSFIKQMNIFVIALMLIAYLGIISIQGLYVTSFDKFSVKTVKFAIGNFIPVIGGFVSDSIDVLLSASCVLKGVLGSVGLIILIAICMLPVLKMLAIMIVYKISAIVIEPISDDSIPNYLNQMGNLIAILLASVVVIGIMFFITIAILASIGNVTKV